MNYLLYASHQSLFCRILIVKVALTISGGGDRAQLTGAGVIQAFDDRDSNVSTSGLYQSLTYIAGLSGGGWLLSSMAGNNFRTISYLKETFWKPALVDTLFLPDSVLAPVALADITADVLEKDLAGFPTTITDPWGRLLSYQLLPGSDGGVDITLSSIAQLSSFSSHDVPFPILTSLGVKTWLGECGPLINATTYEFSPYEFGSWDSDVSAFTPTKYLGTSLHNGKPTQTCVVNYDNLGYILGTSSNVFTALCLTDAPLPDSGGNNITNLLIGILDQVHGVLTLDDYATYKHPFYAYNSPTGTANPANDIAAQPSLSLADGGIAGQNNPIFPFLQPARNVSVIIVNDNSADSNNFPNGSSLLGTYSQSLSHGYTRMPFIPPVETIVAEGLNKRASFFGCDEPNKITIVFLPNVNFTFASNVDTLKLQYSESETDGMIDNGLHVATQGGKAGWATCLACALMMKTGQRLATDCEACFKEYCYYTS
jgi:lysophospholipase